MVRPDVVVETQTFGQVPCVSDQAFLEAVLAAAQTVALAGGVLSVVVDRHPTDVEHESVTTGALIEWKNRTDAKAQPEPVTATAASVQQPAAPEPPADELLDVPERENVLVGVGASPDGLDETRLDDEDLESIPPHLR